MKKIPYGISNFRKLIEDNYFYIDKTNYIDEIESFNEPYLVFLRPRRFGKSLFISMFEYYYDIKYVTTQATRLSPITLSFLAFPLLKEPSHNLKSKVVAGRPKVGLCGF